MSSTERLRWDFDRIALQPFEQYWEKRPAQYLPLSLFDGERPVWLEIGAGSGGFFCELARQNPQTQLIAIERCRQRAKRLVRKAGKSGLPNLAAFRANVIPALVHGIPSETVERVYILYPCPWPKTSHRKHRWYLHPVMAHLKRILKRGGLLVWASDQQFYIDEARTVCEKFYGFSVLGHGPIAPGPYNHLERFPTGRSKFEQSFLERGQPCFELILQKPA